MYPEILKYTESHQWIRVEEGVGTVGITHYGQEKMGNIVYVELPEKGREVKKGESFSTLESVKAVFGVPSPVSGRITEVNKSLEDDPSLINKDPYNRGWLVKIKISDHSELDLLLTSGDYENVVKEEID
ncbi:MAG TPA: glycine cleavage system protein GcvH [Candidatus Aerophobetes bacterium]|uniref:Glycine cleavage system H protein n=1 Tax=Aerophobetes bacterium TaxID=2030807 RepID=A0A7V5HZ61_UNCAE|nr:glycine cleavage system protein GcvH [Candidatus Aerophobetes bacterium]